MSKDYLLKIKIQNNRIVDLMRKNGIKTGAELSRKLKKGISETNEINGLIAMTISPFYKVGKNKNNWREIVILMADFFKVMPYDLFNERQLNSQRKKNYIETSISDIEIENLILGNNINNKNQLENVENEEYVKYLLKNSNLNYRENKVLQLRYYENNTLEEVADELEVSRERVRQIEKNGLRKMSWNL